MSRLSSVDALRSLAIILVLVSHYAPADQFLGSNGIEGVYIFFVCSGFLIAHTTANRENLFKLNVQAFYWRRFTRLAPLLIVTLALAAIFNYWLPLNRHLTATLYVDNPMWLLPFVPFSGLWRLWAVPAFGIKGIFWGLLWTLACEFHAYLTFPWLMRWAKTQRKAIAILSAIVVIGIVTSNFALFMPIVGEWSHTNAFGAYALFSIGVLLHFATLKPITKFAAFWAASLGAILMLLAIAAFDFSNAWVRVCSPYVVGIATALLLVGLLSLNAKIPLWLCLPGQLCYGLYLWHPFALYLLWGQGGIVGYLAVSMAIAWLSYVLIETPAAKWLRSKK